MQSIQVVKKPIQATIFIPGSKSITHRALLLAALADGVSELFNILISDDTCVFIEALHELGVTVMLDKETRSCIVGGVGGAFPKKQAAVWCGDAETAAQFLLVACAATSGVYQFSGSIQLSSQPILTLLKILQMQGMVINPESAKTMPFEIIGAEGLQGGELTIDSSENGQFVSALLMLAPFAKIPMLLKTESLVSEPYVDMTCAMMSEFGVLARRMHSARFYVPIPQRYHARDYTVEPDLSTAAYFFAAAAVTGGEVSIQAIDRASSKQGDVAFLTILEKMGCKISETSQSLTVKGVTELQGINVDMRHFSDTFMTLAAIAPFAKTPTTMTNIAHARLKESDRIMAMHQGLERLKIKVESGSDWIKVYPGIPQAAMIDSFNDHRIAMAFAVMGLRVAGIKIAGAECVSKACPEFFKLWEKLVV